MPVIYATFGRQMESLIQSGIIPQAFLRYSGRACSASMPRSRSASAPDRHRAPGGLPRRVRGGRVAGERQSGTLEVLLARPLSRRSVFVTLLVAILGVAVVTSAAAVLGTVVGSAAYGLVGELDAGHEALLFLNTVLLLAALAGISLAGLGVVRPPRSGDRHRPRGRAARVRAQILGQLWPGRGGGAAVLAVPPLRPFAILGGQGDRRTCWSAAVFAIAVGYGLWRFPRRPGRPVVMSRHALGPR
jgi:hypothetical protein